MPATIHRTGWPLILAAAVCFAPGAPGAETAPLAPGAEPAAASPPSEAAPSPAASEPAPPSVPSFFGTVEVELTELKVQVLDRRGEPVEGLSSEHFEVFEEGKRVEVTHFSALSPEPAEAAAEPGSGEPAAPGEAPPEPPLIPAPAATDESPEDLFVLFVDEESLELSDRRLALEGFGEVLAQGGTTMMIVAHGLTGDRTVLGPTTDPAAATAAVHDLIHERPIGELAASRRRMRSQLESIAPSFARLQEMRNFSQLDDSDQYFILAEVRRLHSAIEMHAREERAAGENTLASLRRLSLALCGRPGAKTLAYLGAGVPQTPGQDLMLAWDHHFSSFSPTLRVQSHIASGLSESLVPRLAEVASFLNACGATFLAVDSAGLRPPAAITAASSTGTEVMAGFEDAGLSDRRAGLLNLAEATGGTVTPGGMGLAARLQRTRRQSRPGYVLAYPRPQRPAGTTRRIEVRLPGRPELRVRHRRSFAELGSDAMLEQRVLAALQFGPGTENPLDVRLEAGPPAPEGDGKFVVPVRVLVRLARVGIEPGEREHKGHLTMALAARDEKGRLSPVQRGEQVLSIPHDKLLAALSGVAAYTFSVRVRDGRQALAVAVRDDVTRLISVGQVEVGPPG